MKKIVVLAFCLLLLFCFITSCQKTNHLELVVCGSYGVPGMVCYDMKGGSCDYSILEEDSYGRILFEYTTENVITGKEETAIVICQAVDSDYVFFYEDQCYAFSDNKQHTVESLKQANDWDLPLNGEKTSRRKVKYSLDMFLITESTLDIKKLRKTCCGVLQIKENQIYELCILDCDSHGRELFFLETDGANRFLVLFDSEYNASLLEIQDEQIDPAEIAEFKKVNNWYYGSYAHEI